MKTEFQPLVVKHGKIFLLSNLGVVTATECSVAVLGAMLPLDSGKSGSGHFQNHSDLKSTHVHSTPFLRSNISAAYRMA